jgi:DNA primase
MPFISEACKERIRSRVPLEELLRDYHIQLLPAGRKLKALCPFHAEKTPSFQVDVERQFYYCFGCQEGGDLFRFIQTLHQVDFPQAAEMLARRAGVPLEFEGGQAPGGEARHGRGTLELYDVLAAARDFYQKTLAEGAGRVAREYLKRRGIEPALWESFQLGFAPAESDALLRFLGRKGASPALLERAGLVKARQEGGHYDYFRGRLMFPIADVQNRVVGFGARTLGDDVPKYLNTPKTAIFDKSQVLYGLSQARTGIRREGRIAIVEGYTDAIMAHQAGLDFFVASLGTAFTRENARRLGRIAPRVLLLFDGDDAGLRATERSLELLVAENLDVRIYTVTDGKDPCDAILTLGAEEFRRRFEAESVGIFEFKWRRTVGRADAAEPAIRARALDEFLDLLARIPNVVARKLYLRQFAERVGVAEEEIERRLKEVARRSLSGRRDASPAHSPSRLARAAGGPDAGEDREPGESAAEVQALEALTIECVLALAHRAAEIWNAVPAGFFLRPPWRAVAEAVQRQIAGGSLSPERLVREVEDPEASRLLAGVLSRVEDEDGSLSRDYESVWACAERDLERFVARKRIDELKRRLGVEEPRGESANLVSLRREYFEALRELKKR